MTSATPWVYFFSKFTPEALVLEALLICALFCAYAAYWVLKKRKQGAAGAEIPGTVVKTYLNELITDAEQLRMQLFGLLSASGIAIPHGIAPQPIASASSQAAPQPVAAPAPRASTTVVQDPELLAKLAALESRMSEQTRAMETIVSEKIKLEKELATAKTATAPVSGGVDPTVVVQLQDKIKLLEAKLAEYSVIEDDLANLKRLQQENTQLKAAIGGKGVETPTAAAPAAATTPAPAPTPSPAPAPAASAPSADAAFEGLVDTLEETLQPAADPLAEPAAPAEAPSAEPAAAAPAASEKSDADLVAEFEKMLNG